MAENEAVRVFISYSHDNEAHETRVRGLAERLMGDGGIDCIIDQWVPTGSPPEGWPKWMDREVLAADIVLVVCTQRYHARVMGSEKAGVGLGVRWESTLLYQHIYDEHSETAKFIVVLFDEADRPFIPTPIKSGNHYLLERDYNSLYRRITKQTLFSKPAVRPMTVLATAPPVAGAGGAPSSAPVAVAPARVDTTRMPITSGDLFGRGRDMALLDATWSERKVAVLTLLAWGGAGKTALVNHWLAAMASDHWRGAARVLAWSFYSQGASDNRSGSSDQFIAWALGWLSDPDINRGSLWDKAARLADLVLAEPTLVVLDGLEPLQMPPGVDGGRLRDTPLGAFLRKLAGNPGISLCVVSSRLKIADLDNFEGKTTHTESLESLSREAGAALLESLGVRGSRQEMERAVTEFDGHALALTLLGRYIADACEGDVLRRREIGPLLDLATSGGHARRVMTSYEAWLGPRERALLGVIGLFDRPATLGAVDAVLAPPVITGLTEALAGLRPADFNLAVTTLRRARLLAAADQREPTLDAHPLVREYFGEALRRKHLVAWRKAHHRLFRWYAASVEELPSTLEGLGPLYAAVHHGCNAGKHQEVLSRVYISRINRRNQFFSTHKLGAYGADLGALAEFFEEPWTRPVRTLEEAAQTK